MKYIKIHLYLCVYTLKKEIQEMRKPIPLLWPDPRYETKKISPSEETPRKQSSVPWLLSRQPYASTSTCTLPRQLDQNHPPRRSPRSPPREAIMPKLQTNSNETREAALSNQDEPPRHTRQWWYHNTPGVSKKRFGSRRESDSLV